ncbi:beta-1,3-galactosyltransferase 1-like [Polymixia lowei]
MLDHASADRKQRQEMVDDGKLAESGRYCSFSRQRCFCLILLLATLLFFYNTNLKEMATEWSPKWWTQYHATKWWMPFKTSNLTTVPPNTDGFLQTLMASTQKGTHATTVATTNATIVSTANMVTQMNTESNAMLPTPIPYVSPGPYLVEYPYKYHFIINESEKCKQQKPFLVLVVPVAPHNRAHRDTIRSTWGSENLILGKVVNLFFLLGLPIGEGAEQVQQQVLQESREYQDLLQSDFLDCYKNLTIKTMVMLEWLDSQCSSASYAMKIDSDMFLNVYNLVNMLLKAPKEKYMTGLVAHGAAVLRDPHSKWYLPAEVFPESQYPRYALGLGYVLSLDLPRKLVEASRHVKAVYIEDVYLGLCMRYLDIPPTNPPDWNQFHVVPLPYSRCGYSKLIATTTNDNIGQLWKDFKRPAPFC